MVSSELEENTRKRLALALDLDDLVAATRMAKRLKPWFGVAKVGLELFAAAGPEAISAFTDMGYEVFLDLKLHDIPTTVRKASQVIGSLGVSYLTVHTSGGVEMLSAAVEGLKAGAEAVDVEPGKVLGVTILTSDVSAPREEFELRVGRAVEAGCGGLVCAVTDLADASLLAPNLMKMVPGIRPVGSAADDQARIGTPSSAIGQGADVLVIGRAVTAAIEPELVSAAIHKEITPLIR
ncbi:MAG: orotidine-5'-phosphate decarboxylase [Actinomycetota bacterium]|jgi:orotidine-5'-phosphate decarboxylase|nr:orotidine-5'-phosphate decarboxylase [Acidimicrobiales bacterium]